MNILKEQSNTLLKRKELIVEKEYPSNPGFSQVAQDLASKYKAGEDVVIVRRVGSHFGTNVFRIEASIYDSVEAKETTEPKPKKKGSN